MNFTKLSKHCLEFGVVSASFKALDKEVEEATGFALALLTPLMSEHLNLLAVELESSGLFDSSSRRLLALELDISEASCLTVWIKLKLA